MAAVCLFIRYCPCLLYTSTFTAKQVGERVKERRTELNLTMPELGKRVGVNKSTIQRYEADGVDPKRTMIINGLAEALLTLSLIHI